MVTTGLVSLNVHEALSFEGTPICLHPDLFSPVTEAPSYHSASTTVVAANRLAVGARSLPLNPSMSSDAILSDNNNSNSKTLQVGDMIEIRVWDPLPTNRQQAQHNLASSSSSLNVSSIMRQRVSLTASNSSLSQAGVSASSTDSAVGGSTDHETAQGVGSIDQLHANDSSMQYSDASQANTTETEDKNSGSSKLETSGAVSASTTVSSKEHATAATQASAVPSPPPSAIENDDNPPTKTVITNVELPPIVPRSRSDTADSNFRNPGNKPPLQRRVTAAAAAAAQPIAAAPPPLLPRGPTGKQTRHVRDLSDMTADSTLYGAAALDGAGGGSQTTTAHQRQQSLGDFQLSADDEEDHLWTTTSMFSHSHTLRMSFVMLVTEKTLTSLKGSARTQVSILRQVADLYHVSSYDMVTIHKVSKEEELDALEAVSADFVLVTIKDQFISRGDMHFFQESLLGSWVYEGQRLYEATRGIQANAKEIRHAKQQALSGIVTEKTTFTYRSRSARIVWLVQISAEMWDYASPYERGQEESLCEIYFDKWIAFLHELFAKWKELEATHSLTVVFFSRSFLGSTSMLQRDKGHQHDVYGRRYEDHYRTVLENETGPDWDPLVVKIKEAFTKYPTEVGWALGDNARHPSTANQGNLLEAVNVTLNLLQYHYLDRDLQRTGNSIVVVSAGNGVFEVDKSLAGITYQRMMDNGIGSDMLSLALPALHIAPFFLYKNVYESAEMEDADAQEHYYEVPHWMHLSFVSYESDFSVFVDHLHESEVQKESRNRRSNDAGLEILPNGFLLPRETSDADLESPSSPLLRPTSFTARGNAASSPVGKTKGVSSGQQLIAGRDFRDILEACRPRNTGKLPSALRALLLMNDGRNDQAAADLEKSGKESEKQSLKEWGTLDFDDVRIGKRSISLGQDPESPQRLSKSPPCVSALAPLLKMRHDSGSDKGAEGSSQSSSFASQVSSSVLGISYDRPYLAAHQASPSLSAVQLQRSPSLEFCLFDENNSDTALGSDTIGASSDEDDFIKPGNGEDRLTDKLRAMMCKLDTAAVAAPSPKLTAKTETTANKRESKNRAQASVQAKSNSGAGTSTSQRHFISSHGISTGGLEAALTQYRSTSNGAAVVDTEQGISRANSTGRISGNGPAPFRQMAEMGSLGLSPLLLPPVAMGRTELPDRMPQGILPSQAAFERRLFRPQDFTPRSPGLLGARIVESSVDTRKRDESQLSTSPPTIKRFGRSPTARREQQASIKQRSRTRARGAPPSTTRHGVGSRKKKAFNPFRQEDEVEVLAKKSHNRRRWSHVFPLGEVEFKRHAGPNWKSLTAPAILPLGIDYFPTTLNNFTSSFYNVTLSEFEKRNFSSNKDLLDEMVRQRLTQDFQLVAKDCINASNYGRASRLTHGGIVVAEEESSGTIRQFLSMGHRLQVLTYNAAADLIEVTRYDAEHAQKSFTSQYEYYSYCQETGCYSLVKQTFSKFSTQYNWNKVDRLICGDDDREMREGMRFKRVMFGIIPEKFNGDSIAEKAYVAKFGRLLEYFEKLREKDESREPLGIKIVTSSDKQSPGRSQRVISTPGLGVNSMSRFYLQLRKGKRDSLEYVEIAVDCTFDTSWSYRIMFSWLVASSGKIDTQVQLLLRRCKSYGLTIVPFPHVSVSKSVYLNPFKAPAILTIRDKQKSKSLDNALTQNDFIHDGVFHTDIRTILDCTDRSDEFQFGRWGASVTGRQFVHRSGTLFVRVLTDRNGLVILVVLGNYRFIMLNKTDTTKSSYQHAFKSLTDCISTLEAVDDMQIPKIEKNTSEEDIKESERSASM